MYKELAGCILIANILLGLLVPTTLSTSSTDDFLWWNEEWSFREEIVIPINTSSEYASYKPVDIHVEFENSCWAKNEDEHSIRVIFQDGSRFIELESQIYNLNYSDEGEIESCDLVFLVPEEAEGVESYYVYYDDEKKSDPGYLNRVDIGESYYRYEQIPGLLFESSFYKIMQGDNIVYAVNKEGAAFGDPASQQIAKLKKETKNVMPNRGEIAASFGCIYWWYENEYWYFSSSSERLVKHQRIIDGNLMVKIGIVSESNDGLLRSTVFYKYYYCPTVDKRIYTHVKHEIIDYPLPVGERAEVTYASIVSGSVKSSSIEELNFGRIFPYLHFYSDEERVFTYKVDPYPETEGWQLIIGREDDYDLGSIPWLSVDDGESGKAHAVIFETNQVEKFGDEKDSGMDLRLYESNTIQLPGVDNRNAIVYIMRNSYEKGEEIDSKLPEDYVVEYNAEFFTTDNGGYQLVEKEAEMYQSLVGFQPTHEDDVTGEEEVERYNLTAYVHFAPSFPFGSLLSTVTGLNFSYISAELYKDNSFSSSGSVNRLPLSKNIPGGLSNMKLIETIKMVQSLFDWENFSFYKKIRFPFLEQGRYLIKIFREKPFLSEKRQFIGYAILKIDKDKDVHIYCKPEGKIRLSFLNQDKKGIENVQVYLKKEDVIIEKTDSDSQGSAVIKAPCGFKEEYTLYILYKGFLIHEKPVRLGIIRFLIPLEKSFNFKVYGLNITVRDYMGEIPEFDVDFSLTSEEMDNPISIVVDSVFKGTYVFDDLYPADYNLTIRYNQFEVKEKICIPNINSLEINLYDFAAYVKDSWNLPSEAISDVTLTSIDFGKTVVLTGEQLSTEKYHFTNLYPGNYTFKVSYKSYTVEESISIPNVKNITMIFPVEFNVTTTVFDSHGNQLANAKVLMIRGYNTSWEKETIGFTDDQGKVIFSLPPGNYVNKIFSNGELVGERKVEVTNKKGYEIVTTDEPLLPSIIIGLTLVILTGFAILSYRKKDVVFFLKILAVSLVIIAMVNPWWGIEGESSDSQLETSTKLFLIPAEMVTMTSNDNVTAGTLASMDGSEAEIDFLFATLVVNFTFAMGFLIGILILSMILVISSLIINKYFKRKFSLVMLIFSIIILVGSIFVFSYAMSELAEETVGSYIGTGDLNVDIPGENLYEIVPSSWGPTTGFYLLLGSIVILIISLCLNTRMTILRFLKKIKHLK